jgi:hypothetical protein
MNWGKIQKNLREYQHMRTRIKRSLSKSKSRDNSLISDSLNQHPSALFGKSSKKDISSNGKDLTVSVRTVNNLSHIAQKSG